MDLQDDEYLHNFINSAPIGIAVLDAVTLHAESLNEKFLEIAGKPKEAILGRWYWEPFGEVQHLFEKDLDRAAQGETIRGEHLEIPLIRHGVQEMIVINFVYAPIKNSGGKVTKIAVWVMETTREVQSRRAAVQRNKDLVNAHELAETLHEQRHAELKGLFNHAPVAMATFIGPKFVIGLYNELVLQFWGRTAEQVAGMPLFEALPEAAGQGFEELLTRVYTTGVSFRASELPVKLLRNGITEDTFIDFIYEPLRDDDHHIYGILVVCIEITEQVHARVKAEQLNSELRAANEILTNLTKNLSESEARFRSLAEGSEVMVSVNEVNGNVLFVNQAWLNLTGRTQQEMQALGWGDFLHPDDREQILKKFHAGIDSREAFTLEFRMMNRNNEARHIYTKINPRLLPDGSYNGTISSSLDITDRVKADQEIGEANQRLNIALDAGRFGITEVDLASGTMICNQRFKYLFGRFKDEPMVYADMFEAMLPKYREEIRARVRNAQDGHTLYQATYEIRWPDGSLHWLEAHGLARYDKNDQPFKMVGILADVTEQITARLKLEQAEANLRLAAEAASLGTWHINIETRELLANDRLRELFGFYPGETVTVAGCIAQITDDYREVVTAAIEKAITAGGDYDITYTVKGFHDQQIRWVRAAGNLKVDTSGKFTAFTGVIMDITEQRQDDQRKNDFIAMVSHELKTPLTSLLGYVQMLQMITKKQEDQKLNDILEKSRGQVKKMNTMITGFLDMARFQSGKIHLQKQEFELNELLADVVADALLVSTSHQIVFPEAPLIKLYADRDKIGQVVTNLLSNAVKYSPNGTMITVQCKTNSGIVTVSVTDQGMGISTANRAKLFDRFYRVEGKQAETISGFGIGLYLSAEIIQRHEGRIGVDSELGHGSSFYFNIPQS